MRKSGGVFADAKSCPGGIWHRKGEKGIKISRKKHGWPGKGIGPEFFIFIRKMYKTDKKAGGFIGIGHE